MIQISLFNPPPEVNILDSKGKAKKKRVKLDTTPKPYDRLKAARMVKKAFHFEKFDDYAIPDDD